MIDYLQLMSASGMKLGSREQEVSTISRSLKALAKELNIPIIALSQLNRSTETREDKRPVLSDLRESGAIEQDADMVCFIHRPEYYTHSPEDANGNDIRGLAELIVAKHRSGAVGDVKLRFVSKYARFDNWSEGFAEIEESMNKDVKTVRHESKMNSDAAPSEGGFAVTGTPLTDMPDIMPGPGESPVPF
jgi:replicative DNA helicase